MCEKRPILYCNSLSYDCSYLQEIKFPIIPKNDFISRLIVNWKNCGKEKPNYITWFNNLRIWEKIGLSFEIELNAKLVVTLQRCKFLYTIGRMIFFIQNQWNKSAIFLSFDSLTTMYSRNIYSSTPKNFF